MQSKDLIVAVLLLCVIYFAHTNYAQLQEQIKVLSRENSILSVFVPTKEALSAPTTNITSKQEQHPKSPFPPREDESYGMGLSQNVGAPLPEQYTSSSGVPELPTYA